jgi:hypothetical protein
MDVRDLMEYRAGLVRDGLPFDPVVEFAATRLLVAELVAVKLVDDGCWFTLPIVVGDRASIQAAVDALVVQLEARIVRIIDAQTRIREVVVASYARDVACLLVEMACLSFAMTAVHAGCGTFLSRRRVRRKARPRLDPVAMVRSAACLRDPAVFLIDAQARLAEAMEDVKRARTRLGHVRAGRVKKLSPPGTSLAAVEDPASRGALGPLLGATPDLLAGALPPVSSAGRVVRRRSLASRGDMVPRRRRDAALPVVEEEDPGEVLPGLGPLASGA